MNAIATRVTTADLDAILQARGSDDRIELIDGEIIEKPMPTDQHSRIVLRISIRVGTHILDTGRADGGPEGRYADPDDPDNSFLPDFAFTLVPEGGLPVVTRGAVMRMPDFAVEVQSPDEKLTDMRAKAATYLRLGARLVWLVIPAQKIVISLWADGGEALHGVDDTFDFGDLLPGFSVAVREIFV